MHTRMRALAQHRLSTLLLVLLASLLLVAPITQGSDYPGITVTNSVAVQDVARVNEIPLVTLVTEPDAPEAAFELKWNKDTSAWFPTWVLQLDSDLQLISGANQAVAELGRISPAVGHTYEAALSYSPSLGIVAIKVTDTADDRVIYSGAVQVAAYDEPLYAAAGARVDTYLPIGNTWASGQATQTGTFLPIYVFETRDAPAIVRLSMPAPLPPDAAYRLYVENGENDRLIAHVAPGSQEERITIPLADLPLGPSTLRLDYVVGDTVLISETRTVILGRLDFWMAPVVVERADAVVKASFNVHSAEPLVDQVEVSVHAALSELVWNETNRQFDVVPYDARNVYRGTVDLTTGVAEVVVDIPLPDRAGNWQVTVTPTAYPEVATHVGGHERLFSTHKPAQVDEGEPYTIVVFPDTQYFSAHHPHIYTRMTDWVTASADEYNIAALLHVGDITDNNSTGQWENAFRSMSLLHDVVPYVLTIGNHDMVLGGVRRGVTRINDYFSEEAARRYSNLAGTLVPGRIENSYSLFSIAGDDYVVVALEFGPPDEAVAWAGEVASAYPDHKLILLTHSYTTKGGGRSNSAASYDIGTDPHTTVNTAPAIWQKLLRNQPNAYLVISGHTSPELPVVAYGYGRTLHGNSVFELLFDWQTQPNGGNGWLGLITVNPDGTLQVRVYSPYLDEWASYTDGNGFTSELIIDHERTLARRIR